MLLVHDVFIPRRLFSLTFACPYDVCGGMCCVNGDSGAPATAEEIERIEAHIDQIQSSMDANSRQWLKRSGVYESRGAKLSIQCIEGHGRCVFFTESREGAGCVLESVSRSMGIPTLRPLSCRLFPLRVRHYNGLTVLDFEVWKECGSAWNKDTLLLDTCRDALMDAFGQPWLDALDKVRRRFAESSGSE